MSLPISLNHKVQDKMIGITQNIFLNAFSISGIWVIILPTSGFVEIHSREPYRRKHQSYMNLVTYQVLGFYFKSFFVHRHEMPSAGNCNCVFNSLDFIDFVNVLLKIRMTTHFQIQCSAIYLCISQNPVLIHVSAWKSWSCMITKNDIIFFILWPRLYLTIMKTI